MFIKLCLLFLIGVTLPVLTKAYHNDNGFSRRRPVFFAFLKNSITFRGNDVLKFDQVTTNIGNGYNKYTGLFTAPRDGVYIFGCVMVSSNGNTVHYWIYKNNSIFTAGHVARTAHANSNTQHVIVELKKGDTLSIRHRTRRYETVHGEHHSYVFGYQLN